MRTNWRRYLDDYHRKHPAITEEILTQCRDGQRENPYDWLLSALPSSAQSVVDIACGSAPMAADLAARGTYLGVDRSAAELQVAAEANPDLSFTEADVLDLPMESGSVDAAVCSMALMLLQPLREALQEIDRVLSPGGTLVAIFPVNGTANLAQLRLLIPTFARLRSLPVWPQRISKRSLIQATAGLGLQLQDFRTKTFDWTISDAATARRMIEGLYLPNANWAHKESAIDYVTSQSKRNPTVPIHIGRAFLTVPIVESGRSADSGL